ncbi:hypothetical protein CNMCM5793_009350 [Aspergillus hiratsukae]|uniref:Uncharacterized protein n=1 Tax=Aspergillus hiratsukae TaxID=1194566 RepID=A0A8H6UDB4_9EURO|nr:hypothetical protein CNMCM5793_009350 [Aspergillus hiratsukae]KAF7171380.1 hypothetical protein CNMCM6106_005775 [Aspergillus hiratsukae]
MKLTTASILLAASSALAVPTNIKRDSYIQISDFWAKAGPVSPGAFMHFVVTDPNYPEDTPTECNLIWTYGHLPKTNARCNNGEYYIKFPNGAPDFNWFTLELQRVNGSIPEDGRVLLRKLMSRVKARTGVRFVCKYEVYPALPQFGKRLPSKANEASSIHSAKTLDLPSIVNYPEYEVPDTLRREPRERKTYKSQSTQTFRSSKPRNMARFSLLLLASAISLPTAASASSLKRDIVKPFQKGRFALSNNASVSQAYNNNLLPRYYDCYPGAHLCDAGQCCDFTCCSDGTCCPAAQLCYNDVKPSKGPTYCCELYTEKDCDTRCVPMMSDCCGDGFYCEYGYKCTSGGCCKWGHTCDGSDDIGSGGGGGYEDDDSTTSSTSTTSEYTYTYTHTEEHTTTSYSETESTTDSTTKTESSTRTRSTDSGSATETETDSSTSIIHLQYEYRFKSPISNNKMQFNPILTLLALAAVAFAQYDDPCGSAKICTADCPNADFFPMIDQCDMVDGKPDCYVNFYCA